jgi:MFS transporter, MHS family, proline/betaine transporter
MTATAEAADIAAAAPRKNVARLIVAVSLGNALEWFDISSYAYFAIYISRAFFPANDSTTSLLLTFGTFGLSFLIRPIGGLMLGAYADRHGRKASLLLSIVLMTFGTLAVALMPSFATIGVAAPLLVIVARLVQGFSAGGEFGSSTAFLVEHLPHRRGFIASWQFTSQGLSAVFSSVFGVALTTWLDPADVQAWGWRIPFLFGVLIGPVGLYIRSYVDDAPAPSVQHQSPVWRIFAEQKLQAVLAIGVLAVSTALNYLIVFIPTYVVKTFKLAPTVGFTATLVANLAIVVLASLAGMMSDGIGRVRHMMIVGLVYLVTIFPTFLLLTRSPTPAIIVISVLYLGILKAVYAGPLAALMAELFPVETRATGLGLSYNIGVTLFGGMGPAIMTWLGTFAAIGELAPGYYLTGVCILSLCALVTIRATAADSHA